MTTPRALAGGVLAEAVADLQRAAVEAPPSVVAAIERLATLASDVAVPYADAAQRIGVSVPTLDAWTKRGLLETAPMVPIRAVTAASLARVLVSVERLRAEAPTKRQVMRLAEELRNAQLLEETKLAVEERRASGEQPTVVTDEELAAL